MPSASNSRFQTVFSVLLSLVIATGLWYLVVGRDHVETQVELRVEYRGLPSGLVVGTGMTNHLSVRLRGSAELLRNLHSRDLVYTVDLSGVKRGANALPLHVADMPDLKPFEILEVMPSRLILEADALTERVVPLSNKMLPLPDNSPYVMSSVMLEPSFVTVKGPEMQVNALESLAVVYDPSKNTIEGQHEANVAIAAPPQVEITPPVTTLRYSLDLKSENIGLDRVIQFDDEDGEYAISPTRVHVELSVPESLAHDMDYLDAVRIAVRPSPNLAPGATADVPPLAMLPSGARLLHVDPASVRITRRSGESADDRLPAESPFTMPASFFGMELPASGVSRDFSLDDIALPAPAMPQPDDLKVQPVLPGEGGKDKAGAPRSTVGVQTMLPAPTPAQPTSPVSNPEPR